jgi:hypothetical protein
MLLITLIRAYSKRKELKIINLGILIKYTSICNFPYDKICP